jgi:hypothetical protein
MMENEIIENLYGEAWVVIGGERGHVRYHIKLRRDRHGAGVVSAAGALLRAAQAAGAFTIELEGGNAVLASITRFRDAFNAEVEIGTAIPEF